MQSQDGEIYLHIKQTFKKKSFLFLPKPLLDELPIIRDNPQMKTDYINYPWV